MVDKQPLLVHFIFHPESTDARNLARQVHQELNQQTLVPGLRVPTMFCPSSEDNRPPGKLGFGQVFYPIGPSLEIRTVPGRAIDNLTRQSNIRW